MVLNFEGLPFSIGMSDFGAVCSCPLRSNSPSSGILLHRLFVLAKDLCIALSYRISLKNQIFFSFN